ncbi:BadF/BadG/BcrA/BcrD ATPase family protein [Agromyces silvae]|uniref:BadF/BadG/BcrA/BcrD ATPase family protein n=1 Tax=Agromyces silvae TaxID=3388266 RepID=UPI00280AC433|nr:BadF/BadG/BcrA/BcrD ATPase family protein [Agromyces protaetiae]
MSLSLGIDLGGSGSRVALRGADGQRREFTGERVGVTATGSSVPDVAVQLLRVARERWPEEFAELTGVGLGATGLASLVADPAALAEAIRVESAAGGAADASRSRPRVVVALDAVTAHLGALGGEAGATVALGTGAIALGGDGRTTWRRVDGWGHLLGDRGGGAWIGRRGLEIAMRAHDGVEASGAALLAAGRARFGDPPGWPAQLYTRADRAGVLAAFAPDVLALAADGDAVAAGIAAEAGAEAARSGVSALMPGLPPRLAATGGLFRAGGVLAESFAATIAELRPGVELREPLGDPLDGALVLAARAARGELAGRGPFVWVAGDPASR